MNIPLTPIRFLRYAREQFPNKLAVVCGNNRFTYKQFADRSARLATPSGPVLSLQQRSLADCEIRHRQYWQLNNGAIAAYFQPFSEYLG